MAQDARPLFIVGTEMEADRIRSVQIAGTSCDARSIHVMDAAGLTNLALEVASGNFVAVVMVPVETGLEDACRQAGATTHAVSSLHMDRYRQAIGSDGTDEMLGDFIAVEAAQALDMVEVERARAARRRLTELSVHDTCEIVTELFNGETDRERIPTGLKGLDDALEGGLPEGGLVALGAMSSMGKTTLCVQVADWIAESGRPVLFVSVEMGRHEIVAKSVSRLMRLTPTPNGGHYGASAWAVQSVKGRSSWVDAKTQAFTAACTYYFSNIAPRMHVMEMEGQPTAAQVRQAAEAVRVWDKERRAPVVFVDYLQLLAPADIHMTERQAVDENVRALRTTAKDLSTCVVAISSLNRASYAEGVTMESFKESGGIEFSSDLILGMQPRGYEDRVDVSEGKRRAEGRKASNEYKGKTIREAEVKVLKNRVGRTPFEPVPLMYDAKHNLFMDDKCADAGAGTGTLTRVR